jgi:hypothetical protein
MLYKCYKILILTVKKVCEPMHIKDIFFALFSSVIFPKLSG